MDFENEKVETINKKESPKPITEEEMALLIKIKKTALALMRRTGYSPQFESRQKTDFVNDIFLDPEIGRKFDNFDYNDPAAYEEFIKLCTVKIKHAIYDHLRKKFAKKRNNDFEFIPLDDCLDLNWITDQKAVSLEEELIIVETWKRFKREFGNKHKNLREIVDYKFIYGLTNEQIVTLISKEKPISLSTVEKTLRLTKDWFQRELKGK